MTTIMMQAIYRGGRLELVRPLDLPEDTPVRLWVEPMLAVKGQQPSPFATLRGVWAEVEFGGSLEVALQKIRAASAKRLERLMRDLATGTEHG